MYDASWPMRTFQPQAPPAKFVFAEEGRRCGQALDSIVSAGCIISGSRIVGSILSPNVRVHSFCAIEHSLLMPGVQGQPPRTRPPGHYRPGRRDSPRCGDRFDPTEDRRRHTVSDEGWSW